MIQIDAIDLQEAKQILVQLASAWQQGLQMPLPVAIKSAFAWLPKQDIEVAKKAYDGDDFNSGELDYDGYLRRFYPEFDDLGVDSFTEWAESLYAKVFTQIKLVKGDN